MIRADFYTEEDGRRASHLGRFETGMGIKMLRSLKAEVGHVTNCSLLAQMIMSHKFDTVMTSSFSDGPRSPAEIGRVHEC